MYLACEKKPCLLTFDAFAPQITKSIIAEFKKLTYITLYILGRCTSFVYVRNVSLNKTLNVLVAQAIEGYTNMYISKYKKRGFTISDQRVLLTKWVGKA